MTVTKDVAATGREDELDTLSPDEIDWDRLDRNIDLARFLVKHGRNSPEIVRRAKTLKSTERAE